MLPHTVVKKNVLNQSANHVILAAMGTCTGKLCPCLLPQGHYASDEGDRADAAALGPSPFEIRVRAPRRVDEAASWSKFAHVLLWCVRAETSSSMNGTC